MHFLSGIEMHFHKTILGLYLFQGKLNGCGTIVAASTQHLHNVQQFPFKI